MKARRTVGSYKDHTVTTDPRTGAVISETYRDVLSMANTTFERAPTVVNKRQFDHYRSPSNYWAHNGKVSFLADVFGVEVAPGAYATSTRTIDGTYALELSNRNVVSSATARLYENELRTKVLNNLKNEVLDVAMVLAEVSGTASTLVSNLSRVCRSMDAVRRRKPEDFYFLMNGRYKDGRSRNKKALSETAGTYLEWKYGIMPTIYDIQGASLALDMSQDGSLFDNPPLMVARSAIRKDGIRGSGNVRGIFGGFTIDTIARIEAKARVDFSVSGEGLYGLSRYGLGLGTVGTVLFDKTPFSFVLNMVLPIADLIKAWTAISSGVDVRGYSETFYAAVSPLPGTYYDNSFMSYTVKAVPESLDFQRLGGTSVPMPLPFIRNPVKVGNVASVLSLATQLLTKG